MWMFAKHPWSFQYIIKYSKLPNIRPKARLPKNPRRCVNLTKSLVLVRATFCKCLCGIIIFVNTHILESDYSTTCLPNAKLVLSTFVLLLSLLCLYTAWEIVYRRCHTPWSIISLLRPFIILIIHFNYHIFDVYIMLAHISICGLELWPRSNMT